ncbi:MAG: copper transporter [Bifidobacteriaceae bacterium]|jgi:hypothetical protein|nr:copper transporter [Bifidobacteriaceae bacterium]
MINFRYHLVSLVAVFIALAIGIVLGAGPIKEPVGSSLADQVSSLRDDKDALRLELESAAAREALADAGFGELRLTALDGLLTGRSVGLLSAGSALDDRIEALMSAVTVAGANLAATIHLEDGLLNGPDEPRHQLASQLGGILGRSLGEDLGDRAMIAQGLAWILAGDLAADGDSNGDGSTGGPNASQPPGADPSRAADPTDGDGQPGGSGGSAGDGAGDGAGNGGETGNGSGDSGEVGDGTNGDGSAANPIADQLWQAFSDSGLVAGSAGQPADVVIVMTGPFASEIAAIAPDDLTAPRQEATVGIVSALLELNLPTVITGPNQAPTDLINRVADSSTLSRAISTVVVPAPQGEAIATLWAAAAELHGLHGAYGLDNGDGPWPPRLPAPVEPTVEDVTPPSGQATNQAEPASLSYTNRRGDCRTTVSAALPQPLIVTSPLVRASLTPRQVGPSWVLSNTHLGRPPALHLCLSAGEGSAFDASSWSPQDPIERPPNTAFRLVNAIGWRNGSAGRS